MEMPFHESQGCVFDDLGEFDGNWKWLEFFKHLLYV